MSSKKIKNLSCAESQEEQASEVEVDISNGDVRLEDAVETKDEQSKEMAKNLVSTSKEEEIQKQVLEKFNVDENFQQSIQENSMQDGNFRNELHQNKSFEKSQEQIQIENIVAQDFIKIQNLQKLGLIDSMQGQNLKSQVLKKAFDKLVQNEKIKQNLLPASQSPHFNKDEVFGEFNREKPDFFAPEGRKEVLDYLKSDDVIIGKDELKKISSMVESIEQKAIDRYLKKVAYENNLKNSNEMAKQKLTANAQNQGFHDKNLSRNFTREQIGKMSSTEFIKYESLIMNQLRKGLIR